MGAGTERTGQRREKTGPNTAAMPFGEVRRNQRESWYTVANLFPIPHRPTKLLIEPAAHKSLKINKVASRALASLLITERGICGNRAGKRAAQDATLATSLRFSMGEQTKKIPTDKSWDFEYWWCSRTLKTNSLYQPMSAAAGVCPCIAGFVHVALSNCGAIRLFLAYL